MTTNINSLIKQYVLWPELDNDFQKNIHFGDTKIEDFRQEIKESAFTKQYIEGKMALFYIHNENLSKARNDSQDVLNIEDLKHYEIYQNTLNVLSKDIFTYILICSLVESRYIMTLQNIDNEFVSHTEMFPHDSINNPTYHFSYGQDLETSLSSIAEHPKGEKFIESRFEDYEAYFTTPQEFKKFQKFFLNINLDLNDILSQRNNQIHQNTVSHFLKYINELSLSEVANYLEIMFTAGHWERYYGGTPWAQIIQHASHFMQGKINAETFIDQAFSLEHNNGNMFNKDFIFEQTNVIDVDYYNAYTQYRHSYYIPLSSLILNAQHLNHIRPLFELKKIYDILSEQDLVLIHSQLQSKKLLGNFNSYHTLEFLRIIHNNSREFSVAFTKIEQQLTISDPDLLKKYVSSEYLDIKQLFKETFSRLNKDSDYDLILDGLKQNNGLFDFWNHLHNVVYGNTLEKNVIKDFSFHLYDLENLPIEAFDKNIIGGKAWSLANMNQLDLPTPKAQVFSTDCCSSYHQHRKQFGQSLNKQFSKLRQYLKDVNKNPILCSIRSGAPISMPGMMDTILNVGIDNSNYDYFCTKMDKNTVDKCINKFMELFCSSRLNKKIYFTNSIEQNLIEFESILELYNLNNPYDIIPINYSFFSFTNSINFPLNKETQIKESLHAVFESWHSERAKAYRIEKNIPDDLGTAAIVQQMVFGNLNEKSCTGVVFSRDCLTGENKLVGEFLPKAQGEDVVSGSVTPFPIEQFKQFDLKSYNELLDIAKRLEQQTGHIQDIEFTVEDGKLYILQHRQAVCSHIANIKLLEDKSLDKSLFLQQINPNMLQPSFTVMTKDEPFVTGISGNSGVITGIVVKSEHDIILFQDNFNHFKKDNEHFGWIFYAELTSPEHMPLMNKTHGFITEKGGFTSHAAIIARSLNKPCIVGLGGEINNRFSSGDIITIDATQGKIWNKEQALSHNHDLTELTANILINHNNIKIEDIDYTDFNEHLKIINHNNRSWVFNLPNATYIDKKPIKKQNFLNIGHKIAMILAAEQTQQIQSKKIFNI